VTNRYHHRLRHLSPVRAETHNARWVRRAVQDGSNCVSQSREDPYVL
jgi:hypothetical protein